MRHLQKNLILMTKDYPVHFKTVEAICINCELLIFTLFPPFRNFASLGLLCFSLRLQKYEIILTCTKKSAVRIKYCTKNCAHSVVALQPAMSSPAMWPICSGRYERREQRKLAFNAETKLRMSCGHSCHGT